MRCPNAVAESRTLGFFGVSVSPGRNALKQNGGGARWTFGIACVLALGLTSSGVAQEPYLFRVGLTGGAGAALDADRNSSFQAGAIQVALGMVTNERTQVTLRLGRIEFDRDVEGFSDARLDYGLIGGEYRFSQSYYDFGITLGLGGYQLQGLELGEKAKASGIGIGLGLLGDFDLSQHLALTAEASVHYAFFDRSPRIYSAAMAGVAIRF